ncbi:MAG: type I-E CRISPR-associated protein Cas5/CasD [Amphritea sp.]|nr:type I-E CRISPR-associated protein Cas5/CasD [Amphritea sp.]
MDYLVFRLYGPLASWGEIAVGESRHTAAYPSKSALIGLLGAALGIRRDQDEAQVTLAQGYLFACNVLAPGSLMRDYHTTQVPDSVGKQVYRTRRDELMHGKDRLGTVLSSRDYRCDSHILVAVRACDNAPFSLEQLAEALQKPKFQLSLGRKACVLSAPLAPTVLPADHLQAAFAQYPYTAVLDSAEQQDRWLPAEPSRYYWEGEQTALMGDVELAGLQQLTRHDMPTSRRRWQFTRRQEWYWQEATA